MDTRIANQNANPPRGMPWHQTTQTNSSSALTRRCALAGAGAFLAANASSRGPRNSSSIRILAICSWVVNAGNVVAAMTLASLEYAVTYLGVPLLMVLGHSNCWAVGMAEASKDFVRRTFGDFEFRKFRLYLWGATYEFLHRNLDCYRLILSKPKQSSA
jgi:hypothetical protein